MVSFNSIKRKGSTGEIDLQMSKRGYAVPNLTEIGTRFIIPDADNATDRCSSRGS